MHVEELVIDGFKSYAVRTVISGWDPQFNAITGLNGSGKSNILDAVCFVLGINNTSNLRAQNLQDLIYKRGQAGVTKASVTITFDNTDKSKSPIGFEQYSKISVTRQIVLGGTSKYLINGHKAQQIQVLNLFQSVQLNINHPNFLIMQGKITKMLNMKPTEILGLIEEAAGTKMYEWQREKAEKTMKKKNLKLQTTENLLREEVEPKLRHLREQKRIVLEYQEVQAELETLSKAVGAHDYKRYSESISENGELLQAAEAEIASNEEEVKELNREIEKLESDVEDMKRRRQEESSKSSLIKDLEDDENSLTNEITRLTTAREIKKQSLVEQQEKIKQGKDNLTHMRETVSKTGKSHQELEDAFTREKAEVEHIKEVLRGKEDLLSTLSTGISSKGSTDGGYISHLQAANKKVSDTKIEIEKNKMRIGHLQSELESNRAKITARQEDIVRLKEELSKRKRNCEVLQLKMAKIGFDMDRFQELKTKDRDLQRLLSQANNRYHDFHRQNPSFEFSYERPSAQFDPRSVKGLAGELFNLPESNSKAATALEVCAGGRLFNVVVDTQHTGAELLEHGKLRKRVTLIPLNKIHSKVLDPRKVSAAKSVGSDKVDLALNLIEYSGDFKKAMEFIFGNRLICEDAETAKKVTFNPQIHAGSVTLEGDYYDPEGRLSGGSRRNTSSMLMKFRQHRELKASVDSLQEQLQSVREELQKQSQLSVQTEPIQHDLQVEQYEVDNLQKKLVSGDSASFIKHNEDLAAEVKDLEAKIADLTTKVHSYTEDAKQIEKDMKEFNSDGATKLRELRNDIDSMSVSLKKREKALGDEHQKFQDSKISVEQLELDIQSVENECRKLDEQSVSLQESIASMDVEIRQQELMLEEKREKISTEKSKLEGIYEELKAMGHTLNDKRKRLVDVNEKLTTNKQSVDKIKSTLSHLQAAVDKIVSEHDWVVDEKILRSVLEQYTNIDTAECHQRIDQLAIKMGAMKKKGINTNIMSQIEQHEKHENSLKTKIKQINKDKKKIEETIKKLDEYKRTELVKTYQKVSEEFGEIFSVLLPQAFAKLVPVNPRQVTDGLEVKVQLGNVWKESLVELSGGQRSLVALSLIMALLQFRPAPLYILDEVDAALDLSHTQSIGHLIKTRFKGSQFMVVSLKEGMFTNANRLFKVRFQEGTSVVTAS
ncbi:DEKNAAC103086 [Brettanomyces naardenensis]|uniref:Structural maintenance of chromosomes protein n=1 Tax=Brettanomyces naardenensis TaxID=13370 RepID=A0A448YME0_BRENA|nr:DEKNAAC103086 [Brettanomyces naardenensis]